MRPYQYTQAHASQKLSTMTFLGIHSVHESKNLNKRFDHHRAGSTAAVADTNAANLALLRLQDTEEGSQDTSAAGTDGVSKCNSAAMDVDFLLREAEQLHVGEGDDAECLVDFECVDGVLGDASVLESLGNGLGRGGGELAGLLSGIAPATDLGNGLQVELLQLSLRDENNSRGTVVERGRVGSSHGTRARDERRLDATKLIVVKLETTRSVLHQKS
jgi:hypothetical protein